jgi:hypothetical protein
VASELHNGEDKEEWAAVDLSVGAGDPTDDSEAPVLGDAADAETGEALGPDGDIRAAGNVDIHNGGARDIDATTVSITQGGARDIEATTVTINQGGAGSIRAEELSISQGGVGLARADHLTLQEGGNAFAVIAEDATLDPEASVFLLIAGSAKGDVRPVLDWRSAAALGAAFALVLGILRRALR